jgi:hypothetical protein
MQSPLFSKIENSESTSADFKVNGHTYNMSCYLVKSKVDNLL